MALIEKEKTVKEIFTGILSDETNILGIVKMAEEVDPIHAIGGCYCHECEYGTDRFNYGNHLFCNEDPKCRRLVYAKGFCDRGEKR